MRTSFLLASGVALLTTLAVAQQPQSPNVPHQQHHDDAAQGGGMMPMMAMMNPSQHVEGRLAFIRAELAITEAQTPQWSAFADAFRANAKRMADLMGGMSGSMPGPGMMGRPMMGSGPMMGPGMMMSSPPASGATLPERFDRAEQRLAASLDALRAIRGPTVQLYGVLSEDQKRIADQLIHGPMGMRGMM